MKVEHLLVNEKKGDVGLLVAKTRTEARDGLSMPVHYVKQTKNSLNISRQMPQMCN